MKSSIIICCHNEENTISDVVKACCKHNEESEIIVVDDGSDDNTETILRELKKEYNFKYERFHVNKGKSAAMAHGIEVSENEIILFFDADVSPIKKEHFDALLRPIMENSADMVLGQPSETFIDYRINPFKPLTGERAMRKIDILPILEDIREVRFGVETFINLFFQAKGKRIKYVLLEGLRHPTKFAKTTPLKAAKAYIQEGQEIAATLMENNDLIIQRIEYLLQQSNLNTKARISELQKEINERILKLKNKTER